MNRRKLLSFVGLGALLASTGAAWAAISRSRNPYYQGPVSDHFDGLVFSDGRIVSKGLRDVLRWQTGKREREPFPALYETPPQDRPPFSIRLRASTC
jgi:hypothetical protein